MRFIGVLSLLLAVGCNSIESACEEIGEHYERCIADELSRADIKECVSRVEQAGDACEAALQDYARCIDEKQPACVPSDGTCVAEAVDYLKYCGA